MKTLFYPLFFLFAGLVLTSCKGDDVVIDGEDGNETTPAVAQRLDSVYYYKGTDVLSSRTILKYNGKGLLASEHVNAYDGKKWYGHFIVDYTYDNNDSLTCRHSYNASADGTPVPDLEEFKFEFTRDANGRLVSEAMYIKQPNYHNEWMPNDHKCDYTYDASGNMISYVYYDCIIPDYEFSQSRKYEYKYGSRGNRISGKRYYWNSFEWCVNAQYEYSYDANNRLIASVDDYFGSKDRVQYSYDNQGNCITIEYSRSDGSSWVSSQKDMYTYNGKGLVTSKISYVYKNNAWDQYDKSVYTYNENGSQTSYTYYTFNGAWKCGATYKYFYSDVK